MNTREKKLVAAVKKLVVALSADIYYDACFDNGVESDSTKAVRAASEATLAVQKVLAEYE